MEQEIREIFEHIINALKEKETKGQLCPETLEILKYDLDFVHHNMR